MKHQKYQGPAGIVEAFKIFDIHIFEEGHKDLFLENRSGGRRVSAQYVEKHDPQIGGYFIDNRDGFDDYLSGTAFESTHTAIA